MRDICMACGRPIFTVHLQGHGITLAQRWTHGGLGVRDRQHVPIPSKPDNLKKCKVIR